jgi:hypothetical protein
MTAMYVQLNNIVRSRNHFAAKTVTHSIRVTVQLGIHATVNYIYILSDVQQSFLGKLMSAMTMQIISNKF